MREVWQVTTHVSNLQRLLSQAVDKSKKNIRLANNLKQQVRIIWVKVTTDCDLRQELRKILKCIVIVV